MRTFRAFATIASLTLAISVAASGCKKDEKPAAPAPKAAEGAPKATEAGETPKVAEEPGTAEAPATEEKAPTEEKAENPAVVPSGPEGTPPAAEVAKAAEPEAKTVENAQQARQKRLQDIYALGRKGDDESVTQLVGIMKGDEEPGIRATAIRVLGREKVDRLVPELTELAKSNVQPVKIEAAILLYQWGDKDNALPILKELSEQGVALRRAFLTGRKDGKNIYDENAKSFLESGLKAENVYTRLDAALGLYEMGQTKKALDIFRDVMEKEETFYVRMAALNYLRHLKDDAPIHKIIEAAKKDKDERVQKRAEQILSEGQQKPANTP